VRTELWMGDAEKEKDLTQSSMSRGGAQSGQRLWGIAAEGLMAIFRTEHAEAQKTPRG